ncbi:MAG: hypothetical protein ACKVW3_03120 [Phycisphaerales bacterium]
MGRQSKDAVGGRAARVRHVLVIAGTVAVAMGLTLGVLVGLPRLRENAQTRLAARQPSLSMPWPEGTWLPASERDRLMAVAMDALDARSDPLSPQSLERLGRALEGTGWFDRVGPIRRQGAGAITIEVAWRAPAAVVRSDATDYLVSKSGRVLPIAYPAGASGYQAIVGARQEPPVVRGQVAAGGVWPGADVRAGLDVIELAAGRAWRGQLAAVDVSEYADRKRIVLVTTFHGRAVWGGAPSDTLPGEVSAVEKLRRLDVLHARFGQIDAKHRMVEVGGPMLLVDNSATAEAP